jgi:hypothetical protein
VHNGLIADLKARQQQHASNMNPRQETIHSFAEKIFLLRLIHQTNQLPDDIYRQAILPVFVRLFASLATLDFYTCTLGAQAGIQIDNPNCMFNPRLNYTFDATAGWKQWRVKTDSHGSYELVQCKTRILPGRQFWVVECSPGDKWIGIAKRDHGYNAGFGCWPETAFTANNNSYIQSTSHRLRLLIFITIDLQEGTIDWDLFDYSRQDLHDVPNPLLWLSNARGTPMDLVRLESYQHEIPPHERNTEYFFSFNLHNPEEYVRLLDYSLMQIR